MAPLVDPGTRSVACSGLGPVQYGKPVLETSVPMAFQQLDFRNGDLGVPLPENQAKR